MNETAIKDRLKIIAKEKSVQFNEAWKQLLLERFLARLSQSEYQEKFIFKGGLLLAQYLVIGRETIDIDFLLQRLKSEISVIEAAIKKIIQINLDDGFLFSWSGIEQLTQPHMAYFGFRVTLDTKLGKMKDKIQLDIGVGDLVDALKSDYHPFEYRGKPIFAGEISLLVYPVETIFSEKLETIVSKGGSNGRMKDYHDVVLMIREPGLLDLGKVRKSIQATFQNRGTAFKNPIVFDDDGVALLQKQWGFHLNSLRDLKDKLGFPDQISVVLKEINTWLAVLF